jgi:mannose/fructose-specific phosphotransferase system component IIA
MKSPFPVLLVTHRAYGTGLLDAARAIVGEVAGVDLQENEGLAPEALGAAIDRWLLAHPGPAVILTDLGFGSCCQAARHSIRERTDVGVVAGANLPVLLALLRSREHADLGGFLAHLAERGRESIQVFRGGRPT